MTGFMQDGALITNVKNARDIAPAASTPVQGGDTPGQPIDTNPVHGGGKGKNTEPTPVDDGDAVSALYDTRGRQVVINNAVPENCEHGYTITNITNTTPRDLLARPGAGVKHYLCDVDISNMSTSVSTI